MGRAFPAPAPAPDRDAYLMNALGKQTRQPLRDLQHEGVAAGDGERPHPHGHHRWEIERRDPGDHAEGLADRTDVVAAEACSLNEPFNSSAKPQAYSTISIPTCTSAVASDRTLPCSDVTMRAISSRLEATR